jgi:hypothetical protein
VRVLVKDDTIVVVRTTSIGTSVVMVDVTVVPDSAIILVRCTKILLSVEHTSNSCRNDCGSQDCCSNLAHLSGSADTRGRDKTG